MAIGDHAISDRAISAPEDIVVLGSSTPARVVLIDRLGPSVEMFDSPARGLWFADASAASVMLADAPARGVALYDGPGPSVSLQDFPP